MNVSLVLVLALAAIAFGKPTPKDPRIKFLMDAYVPDHSRVVNGQDVQSGGRPFQILLARNGAFTCGGSLIASNKVLTAAHCVYGQEGNPSSYTVRYNTLTQTGGTTITVSKIARHESYNSATIDWDVAVLTLAQPFTPGTNAQIIKIASSVPAGAAAIASGFGRTVGGGAVSQTLKQTTLSTLSQSQCQSAMGSINTITARMVCGFKSGTGVCNGDSGGPLTVNGEQVGVASWVVSGCQTAYPSVFANAVNMASWIQAQ